MNRTFRRKQRERQKLKQFSVVPCHTPIFEIERKLKQEMENKLLIGEITNAVEKHYGTR
jgi:hypothetical protein